MAEVKHEISEHYNGDVKIKFYPNSHRYKLEGEKNYLIGVTTATGMLDKSTPLLIWAERLTQDYLCEILENRHIEHEDIENAIKQRTIRLKEAGDTGTLVHDWCEKHIKGEDQDIPENEDVANGVIAFLSWVSENGIKFVGSEIKVYSKKHNYVGTMDTMFTIEKEDHKIIHVGDFKTGSGIYLEQCFQVSAYQEAYTEEHGQKFGSKWILRFIKKDKFDRKTGELTQKAGEFEAKEFKREEHEKHFNGFLACLELKKQDKEFSKLHGYYSKK